MSFGADMMNFKYEIKILRFFELNLDSNMDSYNLVFLSVIIMARIFVLSFPSSHIYGVFVNYFRFSFILFVLRIRILVMIDRFYRLIVG